MRITRYIGPLLVALFAPSGLLIGTTRMQASASADQKGFATAFACPFKSGAEIPAQFTCSGADNSPALSWHDAPQKTQSFVLIVHDPDAPSGDFTHWVLYHVPGTAQSLPQNVVNTDTLPDGSKQGTNGFGRIGYDGPCPPPGKPHRYFFKLYSLDTRLRLDAGACRNQVEQAMKGHVLGRRR